MSKKDNVLLRSIMESPQGMVIFAVDSNYCYTAFTLTHKETMKTIWGVEIEIGMNILNAITDSVDREKARKNFERAIRGEHFVLIEKYGGLDNYRTFYEDRYSPIINKTGRISGVTVFVTDVTERKRAEDALLEAEIKYRMLVERLPVVVYTSELGINGAWHYISPQIEKLLGFTVSEWLTNPGLWYQQLHPEDRENQSALEEQAWARKETFEGEYRMFTRDGRLIWIRDSAQILPPLNNGKPIVQGVLMDITERKLAEDALATSEAELRALFNSMQDLVLVIDRNGVYRKIAPTSPNLLYKPSQEMLGKDLWDIFPADLAEAFNNAMQQVLSTRQTVRIEYSLPIEDHLKWFATSISPMDTENTLWVAHDVTEHKQAGEALRKSDQRLQVFFNQSLDGFFFCNFEEPSEWKNANSKEDVLEYIITTQHFTDVNDAMLKQYGVDREKFLSFTTKDVFAHDMEQGRKLRRELFDKGRLHLETYERKSDGSPVWFEGEYVCLYDEEERITGFFGIQRDITERKLAEQIQSALYEIANVAQTSVSLKDLFTSIHKILGTFMPAGNFYIAMYDSKNDLLSFPYFVDEYDKPPLPQKPGNGLTEYVLNTRQPLLATPQVFKEMILSKKVDLFGVASVDWIGVPLTTGDETFGVMVVQTYNDKLRLNQKDLDLLTFVSTQAAMAIKRKQAEESLHQRTSQLEALREIGLELTSELDVDKLLHSITAHALDLLHSSGGGIYLYRPEQKKLEWVVAIGTQITSLGTVLEYGEGLSGKVWERRKPIIVDDYEHWEGRTARFEGKPFKAVVGVPIVKGDEFLGVLVLLADLPQSFNIQDASLLELFAGYAAVAILNARLYQSARQRLIELEVLYETSKTLSVEHDLNTLLRSVVDNARKLLNTATSGMYLTIPGSDELELSMDTAPYIPLGSHMRFGEGVAGRVAQTRQPLRIDDYSIWEGQSKLYKGTPIRAVVEVPMLYRGELIGVLTAEEAGDSERKFTEADEHLLSLFASQAAGAIHAARLFEETRRRAEEFTSLYETTHDLAMQQNLSTVMDIITKRATALLGIPNATITLYDPSRGDLEIAASIGPDLSIGTRRTLGDGLAGLVAQSRSPLIIDDYQNWEHRSHLYDAIPYTAMMGVPLLYGGNLLGVLDVSDIAPSKRTFNEADVRLLSLFAGQAASAIANAQLFEDLKKSNVEILSSYDTTIEGWSRAMDLRDHETEGHTLRVTELTLKLARGMNLSESQLTHIRRGSLLHDIGKMGVPDAILLKEGKLTEEEWIIMRKHPQLAYEMLSSITYLRDALDIPSSHHEKWDGTGYPHGLKGEDIPLAARIFAVVDVWDAIRSDRPYRKGWDTEKAIEYIKSQSGTHFDPFIVEAFLNLVREE